MAVSGFKSSEKTTEPKIIFEFTTIRNFKKLKYLRISYFCRSTKTFRNNEITQA